MNETTTHDIAGLGARGEAPDLVDAFTPERPVAGVPDARTGARPERRRYTVETLRRSLVDPRRFTARRREDRRDAQLDRFDSGLLALAVLLVGLSILDSLFTLILLSRGGTEENPFMDLVLSQGVWAFAAVKMTLTAVPAVLLVATGSLRLFGRARDGTPRRGIRVRSVLAALVGGYVGLIVYELALLSLG